MNIISFTKQFHKMESELDLFKERDSSGLTFWDIVRFDIFYIIYFKLTKNTKIEDVQKTISPNKARNTIATISKIWAFFKTVFFTKKDNVFFICSRYKDTNGIQYDMASGDLLESFGHNVIIFETFLNGTAYRHKGIVNYGLYFSQILYRFKLIIIPHLVKEDLKLFGDLSDKINIYFGVKLELITLIKELIKRYHLEIYCYNKLFKLIKPKKIFVVQNGIQKALFSSANNLNIPCSEMQHGLIGYIHPAYSYPKSIDNGTLKTLPNNFYTFGDFWTKNLHFPVNSIIPIGNTHFAKKIEKKNIEFELVVVFADIYEEILLEFIDELFINYYRKKICIKLHSNQFHNLKNIEDRYVDYPNLSVITNQQSIDELLAVSDSILAIQSTVVYQALHNNTRVFIYKKLDYNTHEDVFDNPLVSLISSVEDYLSIISTNQKEVNQNYNFSFFEAFNLELLNK